MKFEQARESLRKSAAAANLEAFRKAVPDGVPTDARGYFLKALVLEFGAQGVPADLAGALQCYRMASHLNHNSDSFPFLGIARVLMKQGTQGYSSALPYIQQASMIRHTPEIDLAFASCFESANNLEIAKKHYMKAAISGRFAGFFGLSSVLRKSGKGMQAIFVDCCRILLGPLLFALLGKKARASFDGY